MSLSAANSAVVGFGPRPARLAASALHKDARPHVDQGPHVYERRSCSSTYAPVMTTPQTRRKLCFVTIGATASFDGLVRACLAPEFLTVLAELKYTDLLLQYGKNGEKIMESLCPRPASGARIAHDVEVAGFDFRKEGLSVEMKAAKGQGVRSEEGLVISHAGE